MLGSKNTGWSITVDTGGTFTDVVIADDKGHFIIGKAPTTPDRIFIGLKQALESAAQEIQLSLDEVLGKAELFYKLGSLCNILWTGKIIKSHLTTNLHLFSHL